MEYVYAAMLLHKAGKSVDEKGLEAIITAAGLTADKAKIKSLIEALKDVNIEEVIKEAATAQVAVAPAAAPAGEAAPEEKKESAEDAGKKAAAASEGLGALFG
jgi:large subunit ribosomal protein L12